MKVECVEYPVRGEGGMCGVPVRGEGGMPT